MRTPHPLAHAQLMPYKSAENHQALMKRFNQTMTLVPASCSPRVASASSSSLGVNHCYTVYALGRYFANQMVEEIRAQG